ncbi:hypothetical protein yc1106_01983 [Curvularia clavata]|uniref:Mitochondrial ribosomal protein MRP51 n=1 Tax=Curvularia clavata TaxID=95742 RepID=A0A9Q9DQH8_CURCL|nr:hypothetical protein yc1106_01983 [Curvularia clavata]
MALNRQSLSPTAHLLRNSRLFSLPKPLPRPPVSETFGAGITKASDTATLPYPTHQAIATTKASLARGDWGLKRPIPSRSHLVQVSDPVLRVTQLDTIEHVTDFDSAADHVRTRQKWEEMGVPMMKGMTQMRDMDLSGAPPAGAFEVRDDTTSYDTDVGLDEAGLYLKALKKSMPAERAKAEREAFNATWKEKWAEKQASWRARGWVTELVEFEAFQKEANKARRQAPGSVPWLDEFKTFEQEQKEAKKTLRQKLDSGSTPFRPFTPPPVDPAVHNTKRWKHDGPWLPGMGADDFVAYLSKDITARKAEFNKYLVEFVKNEIYTSRRLAAAKSQNTPPMDIKEAEKWHEQQEKALRHITQADIDAGIRALRKETANDPLASKLVSKLILPFLRLPAIKFKYRAYAQDASSRDVDQYSFDQETAPLSTHPSAGLGYLRTKSYMTNHPILGPQASHAPVPARVVQARRTGTKNEMYARLGVGGFVANDQFKSTETMSASRANIAGAKDVETIDIDTPGGRKIPVQPLFGSVTNDGRIHIKLKRSTGPEVAVARGELDDRPPVRENVDEDPLRGLGSSLGKSGVKELDEQSGEAKELGRFLESVTPRGKKGTPAPGFPGVAEALRGE